MIKLVSSGTKFHQDGLKLNTIYINEGVTFMKCLYCGDEMDQGVIQSPNEISWKHRRHFFGRAEFHKAQLFYRTFFIFSIIIVTDRSQRRP